MYFGEIYSLYRRLTVRSVPFYCAALLSSIKAFFPIESALTFIQLPVFQPRLQSVYTETQQLSTAVMRTTGARCQTPQVRLFVFLNYYYYEFYYLVVVLAQILISELLILSRTLVKY